MSDTTILPPPTHFDAEPFMTTWFAWREIEDCFWAGKQATQMNAGLARIRRRGGVYIFAVSRSAPQAIHPNAAEVRYIGETADFQGRMKNFGASAGFWGARKNGHSAGWRVQDIDRNAELWLAFYLIGESLPPHLAKAMRVWMEALALDEHRRNNGVFPVWNGAHTLST